MFRVDWLELANLADRREGSALCPQSQRSGTLASRLRPALNLVPERLPTYSNNVGSRFVQRYGADGLQTRICAQLRLAVSVGLPDIPS